MKEKLRYLVSGLAIGSVELVPGVSGGTIAIIMGVYHKLLEAVKAFDLNFFRTFFKGRFKEALSLGHWGFILPLALGIGTSIFSLAKLVLYLLNNHPVNIWSFFLGLILASILMLLPRTNFHIPINWLAALGSAALVFWLTGQEGLLMGQGLIFFFLAGFLAICAWILPGISGTFILMLLGKYQAILEAVSTLNFTVMLVFSAGCASGLMVFSRVMSAAFKFFSSVTNAVLIGMMAGSLRVVGPWPWRDKVMTPLPQSAEGLALAALCCLGGVALPIAIQALAARIRGVYVK